MATNPYFTQLHTQRFSFIGSPQQRDGTYNKDQRFVNLYPELIKSPITDGKKYYLKKRPGTATLVTLPAGVSQGLFYWQANTTYYSAISGVLYANNTPILTMTSTTNSVGICEFRTDAVFVLFVCDGNNAWTVGLSNIPTMVTDVNFPRPHLPAPIFLDGYIYVAQNQSIFNSDLGNPLTWPSDGFIDAEMFPDNIQTLTKAQNYIVAVGTGSCEFFYDNANATGSPLQRNAPAVAQFGTPAPSSVTQTEKEVIMIGQTSNGGKTVWVIDGFQPTEIANEPVREALDLEGTNITNASGFCVQSSGHKWYVMNLVQASRTFVYDFEEQMWHEWTSGSTQNAFRYRYATDSSNGHPTLLGYVGGPLVSLDSTVYTDYLDGTIYCTALTTKIDFDTIMRKRFFRLSLAGDAPDGDISVPIQVSWSDDDYNTYTPGINLPLNGNYPTITQLGYARRRAFKFLYTQPLSLRLESFEVDIVQEVRR